MPAYHRLLRGLPLCIAFDQCLAVLSINMTQTPSCQDRFPLTLDDPGHGFTRGRRAGMAFAAARWTSQIGTQDGSGPSAALNSAIFAGVVYVMSRWSPIHAT